ncbi:hypothetical protein DPMN_154120 [Dreissena polymorpha]|uniref:Uncharacterized protein n=1 Tax=Dreissena polymorpha TaxID=45954 RepID=A0A9D4FLE0_DREPO|nr:hypothetical protein DPMN_154120 [Dreissena polymorpha]
MNTITGNAKCHVHGRFGNIRTLYRRTDGETMDQLEAVVNKSSETNITVRYPEWAWRNWKQFTGEHFKTVHGIR